MSVNNRNRFLIEAALAPATIKKYKTGVLLFLTWCDDHNYDATTYEQLDDLLTDYIHDLYEQGDGVGKGLASQTLYGLIKFMPRCMDKLPTATMSVHGWLKMHPAQSYPPLTLDLAVLIAVQMCRQGKLEYGIGTLLAFDCFLRVGELANLRCNDVAGTGDSRMGSEYAGVALRLRATKTGPNQWVQVEDNNVKSLLGALSSTKRGADTKLFPFTAGQYRSLFKKTCAQLGLSHAYVPHSLRHGGATRWHLLGHAIEDILLRGRWASTKSARRYIQAGRAMLLTTSTSRSTAATAKLLAQNVLLSIYLSLPQKH